MIQTLGKILTWFERPSRVPTIVTFHQLFLGALLLLGLPGRTGHLGSSSIDEKQLVNRSREAKVARKINDAW